MSQDEIKLQLSATSSVNMTEAELVPVLDALLTKHPQLVMNAIDRNWEEFWDVIWTPERLPRAIQRIVDVSIIQHLGTHHSAPADTQQ